MIAVLLITLWLTVVVASLPPSARQTPPRTLDLSALIGRKKS